MEANASMEIIADSDTAAQSVEITLWSSASIKVEKVGKLEIPPLEIRWDQEGGASGPTPSQSSIQKKE